MVSPNSACSVFAVFTLGALMFMETTGLAHPKYANSCEKYDTASKLNKLFNADGHTCSHHQSFMCSGFFAHGLDWSLGQVDSLRMATPLGFGTNQGLNFSIGTTALREPKCPETFVDTYPAWCPTTVAIDMGGVSFSYHRRDLAPPISRVHDKKLPLLRQIFGGVGIILAAGESLQPGADAARSIFWNGGKRLLGAFPHDAWSWGRGSCGLGPGELSLMGGLGGPVRDPFLNGGVAGRWCPHPNGTDDDIEATGIPGWKVWCPKHISSADEYNEYTARRADQMMAFASNMTEDPWRGLIVPSKAQCAIPSSRFDELFVPTAKYEKWPAHWRTGFGGGYSEIILRSFAGIEFSDLAASMVFYYSKTDTNDKTYNVSNARASAFQLAKDFADALKFQSLPPIHVPVVEIDPERLVVEASVHDGPVSCPARAHGGPPVHV